MSTLRRHAAFWWLLLAFSFLFASPLSAQTETPPPPTDTPSPTSTPSPTATPVPLLPPSLQETGDWIIAAIPAHGWKLVLVLVVVAALWIASHLLKGFGGALEDVTKGIALTGLFRRGADPTGYYLSHFITDFEDPKVSVQLVSR